MHEIVRKCHSLGNVKIRILSIAFIVESMCSCKQALRNGAKLLKMVHVLPILANFIIWHSCSLFEKLCIVSVNVLVNNWKSWKFQIHLFYWKLFQSNLYFLLHFWSRKFGSQVWLLFSNFKKTKVCRSFIIAVFYVVNQRDQLLVLIISSKHLVSWFLLFIGKCLLI